MAGEVLLPLGRKAAYLAFEGLEVRVLDSVCLEVLTLGRSCKTTNTAELRNTGKSFALEALSPEQFQLTDGQRSWQASRGRGERTVGAARVRAGERLFPAVRPHVVL